MAARGGYYGLRVIKHVWRLVPGLWGLALTALLGALLGGQDQALTGAVLALMIGVAGAARPQPTLLATVALMPLGAALPLSTRVALPWTELLITSGAVGWLWRMAAEGRRIRHPTFALLALALAVTAVTSGVAAFRAGQVAAILPPLDAAEWWRGIVEGMQGGEPLRVALRLAGGVTAAVWAAEVLEDTGARHSAMRLAVVGAAGLASLSVYRLVEIALRSPAPLDRLVEVLLAVRFAPVIGDPNAQTALFLLVLPAAFAIGQARATRVAGALATVVILLGAWLAGSRTALALVPVALGALILLRRRTRPTGRRALAAVAAAVALTLAVLTWSGRHGAGAAAWAIRHDFAVVTARMVAHDPVFGVGIGRYYDRSAGFMPESLKRYYARENAHNQFFQIAGELGVPALLLFSLLVGTALWPPLRCASGETVPLAVGVGAFLASALAQHPLLDPQVAGTFWLLLGTLKAATPPWPTATLGLIAFVWTGAVVALLPTQITRRAADIDLAFQIRGAQRERVSGNVAAFYTTVDAATIYLPADARTCRLRMSARGVRGEARVLMHLDHRPAGSLTLSRGEWLEVSVVLPARNGRLPHRRLDLRWETPRDGAAVDIHTPECR